MRENKVTGTLENYDQAASQSESEFESVNINKDYPNIKGVLLSSTKSEVTKILRNPMSMLE